MTLEEKIEQLRGDHQETLVGVYCYLPIATCLLLLVHCYLSIATCQLLLAYCFILISAHYSLVQQTLHVSFYIDYWLLKGIQLQLSFYKKHL